MADAILHEEYRDKLLKLTEEEQLAVFWAMMDYAAGKEVAPMEGLADMAFSFIADRIDTDAVKYSNKVRAGKRSGASRRENTEEKAEHEQNETCSNKENSVRTENDVFEQDENCSGISISNSISKTISISKEKEKCNKEKAPSGAAHTKRFTPPTLEEVKAYCQERNNGVNPERFIDFYASKGWKVGTSPMKDWKACVRTWEHDDKKAEREEQPRNKFHNFTQRKTDYDAILKAELMKEAEAERKAKEAAQNAGEEKPDEEAVS